MGTIKQLRWWAYKILPLAYDDSLSYYEVLAKATQKLNEVIDTTNKLPNAISEEIKNQLSGNDDDIYNILFGGIINAIATKEADEVTFTPSDKQGGEIIWLGNTLYEVVAPMDAGTNYIVGTNIVPVDIDEELEKIKEYICTHNEYFHQRATQNHDTQTYLYWKDKLYRVDADIKVNDIIAERTTVNGTTTGQLTLVNAMDEITSHYIEMHESDNNLQTQIDGNDGDIEKLQKEDVNLQSQITTNNDFLTKRLDNIVAQGGNDNTEIVDARMDFWGDIQTTLRNAINSDISQCSHITYATIDSLEPKDLLGVTDTGIYTSGVHIGDDNRSSFINLPVDFPNSALGFIEKVYCINKAKTSKCIILEDLSSDYRAVRFVTTDDTGEWKSNSIKNKENVFQFNAETISADYEFDVLSPSKAGWYSSGVHIGTDNIESFKNLPPDFPVPSPQGFVELVYPYAGTQKFVTIYDISSGYIAWCFSTAEGENVWNSNKYKLQLGRKWYSFGDSIAAGTVSYTDGTTNTIKIEDSYLYKYAKNFTNYVFKSEAVSGEGFDNLKQHLDDPERDYSDASLFTIAYGINNYEYRNVPLGTTNDTKDMNTVSGIIRYCIEKMVEIAPTARIIFLTPLNCSLYGNAETKYALNTPSTRGPGFTLKELNDMIIYWCNYYSVKYINLSENVSAYNMLNINTLFPDHLHPSAEGHNQIALALHEMHN